jgi:hypothetical protein
MAMLKSLSLISYISIVMVYNFKIAIIGDWYILVIIWEMGIVGYCS